MIEPGKTYIRKLRVSAPSRDGLALRIRLENLLATAPLNPAHLPASAILFIRRLQMYVSNVAKPDRNIGQLYQLNVSVDQLINRACRPALGAVPADAESVLFVDRAEMLSCLARDWRDGNLFTLWWWKSLIKNENAARVVVREWLDSIEHAPAALERLARQGVLEEFVTRLSESDARIILRSILHKFALTRLKSALDSVYASEARDRIETAAIASSELDTPLSITPPTKAESRSAPPWNRWVREGASESRFSNRYLLVTGLMLVRAPEVARSSEFAAQLLKWHQTTKRNAESESAHTKVYDSLPEDMPAPLSPPISELLKSASSTKSGESRSASNLDAPDIAAKAQISNPVRLKDVERDPEISTATDSESSTHDLQDESQAYNPFVSYSSADSETEPEEKPAPPLLEASIETDFGGVFYLINLSLFLNLYADFTSPVRMGIDLPIWDFLALAARSLIGQRVESDTIWLLLARLAGREANEEPGQRFDPPCEWRIPTEWLAPFSEKSIWITDTSNGRLRVKHPAGFFVIDVANSQVKSRESGVGSGELVVESQIESEMQIHHEIADFEIQYDFLHQDLVEESPLERWFAWLMPYAKSRLSRALGIYEDAVITPLLFESRARVLVSSARVDIFYSLEELPVEVRLSGLDRDPGWVPAAGRYIAFHFE